MHPEQAVPVLVATANFWPLVVVPLFLLVLRRHLTSWAAFLVIGLLVCYGVQSLINLASAYSPAQLAAGASAPERFYQVFVQHLARSLILSVAVSLAPLYWLQRLLRKQVLSRESREA